MAYLINSQSELELVAYTDLEMEGRKLLGTIPETDTESGGCFSLSVKMVAAFTTVLHKDSITQTLKQLGNC